MELTEEATADVTIVAVAGRLDSSTSDRFGNRLGELLQAGRANLLIEASGLTYVSSTGIRALLLAAKSATAKGGRLVVCGMTAPIVEVMQLAGVASEFETFGSREEAMARFARSAVL